MFRLSALEVIHSNADRESFLLVPLRAVPKYAGIDAKGYGEDAFSRTLERRSQQQVCRIHGAY